MSEQWYYLLVDHVLPRIVGYSTIMYCARVNRVWQRAVRAMYDMEPATLCLELVQRSFGSADSASENSHASSDDDDDDDDDDYCVLAKRTYAGCVLAQRKDYAASCTKNLFVCSLPQQSASIIRKAGTCFVPSNAFPMPGPAGWPKGSVTEYQGPDDGFLSLKVCGELFGLWEGTHGRVWNIRLVTRSRTVDISIPSNIIEIMFAKGPCIGDEMQTMYTCDMHTTTFAPVYQMIDMHSFTVAMIVHCTARVDDAARKIISTEKRAELAGFALKKNPDRRCQLDDVQFSNSLDSP